MSFVWMFALALGIGTSTGADTLVVCPRAYRPILAEWADLRQKQGHQLKIVDVPENAESLKKTIRKVNEAGPLRYILIIGDAPSSQDAPEKTAQTLVPTNYVPAKVNTRWGPEKEIASDTPYGDVDGDDIPDIAVGRIPARSAVELAAVLRKIIRYESLTDHGPWEKRLNIVSGTGGFGAVADAMIDAAARQVIQQTVPQGYEVSHIFNSAATAAQPEKEDFVARARRKLTNDGLVWVYAGHGSPTTLVYARDKNGNKSLLSARDVPNLHCGLHPPLAVLVACYTGAMDVPQRCLGEKLLLAEEGPVAVIAATRVTMPYGNTALGCELLRACFREREATWGDVLRLAQQRVLKPLTKKELEKDQLRATLDGLAELISPHPVDLAGERREHVLMYQLFGDPLLRVRHTAPEISQKEPTTTQMVR